jgi:hypothetical protein
MSDMNMTSINHLDDIITTESACEIVRNMFDLESVDPTDWENPEIISFATSAYSQE